MWEPRRLKTRWAFTAYYGHSFTFITLILASIIKIACVSLGFPKWTRSLVFSKLLKAREVAIQLFPRNNNTGSRGHIWLTRRHNSKITRTARLLLLAVRVFPLRSDD
jgi:hypothetical protein